MRPPQPAGAQLLLALRRGARRPRRPTPSRSPRSIRCRRRAGPADDVVVPMGELPTAPACSWCAAGPQAGAALRARGATLTRLGRAPRQRDQPRRHHRVAPPRRDRARPTDGYEVARRRLAERHLRQPASGSRRAVLQHGDELQIGKFRLVFFERADGLRSRDTPYLSIGEVLGLLLDEFPDITISKIRFLESQGLIDAGAHPVGIPQVLRADVELLKVILREQRENYLPLRVIKDRIDSGAIDPSGEMTKPDGLPDVHVGHGPPNDTVRRRHRARRHRARRHRARDAARRRHRRGRRTRPITEPTSTRPSRRPTFRRRRSRPIRLRVGRSRRHRQPGAPMPSRRAPRTAVPTAAAVSPQLLPGVLLEGSELCAMTSITGAELNELRSYGIVTGRDSGGTMLYGDDAVEIAKVGRRVPPRSVSTPGTSGAGARQPNERRRCSSSSSRRVTSAQPRGANGSAQPAPPARCVGRQVAGGADAHSAPPPLRGLA